MKSPWENDPDVFQAVLPLGVAVPLSTGLGS